MSFSIPGLGALSNVSPFSTQLTGVVQQLTTQLMNYVNSTVQQVLGSLGGTSGWFGDGSGAVTQDSAVPISNRPPGSGSNAGEIAESYRGRWASDLERADGDIPMQNIGMPTKDCANFVSAVLEKAGLLKHSEHTNSVDQLKATLLAKGWKRVDPSQAKPGDVWLVQRGNGSGHTEIVAKNENGKITLIGSNNTGGGSGPQRISYDSSIESGGIFLAPPGR